MSRHGNSRRLRELGRHKPFLFLFELFLLKPDDPKDDTLYSDQYNFSSGHRLHTLYNQERNFPFDGWFIAHEETYSIKFHLP